MTRQTPHDHPCGHCQMPVPCNAPMEYNPDGWPVAWCTDYHEHGSPESFLCEDCAALPDCEQFDGGDFCDGDKATEVRDDSGGYLPVRHYCKECAKAYDDWLNNYDGPGDVGEAICGAAELVRVMDEARKLK